MHDDQVEAHKRPQAIEDLMQHVRRLCAEHGMSATLACIVPTETGGRVYGQIATPPGHPIQHTEQGLIFYPLVPDAGRQTMTLFECLVQYGKELVLNVQEAVEGLTRAGVWPPPAHHFPHVGPEDLN